MYIVLKKGINVPLGFKARTALLQLTLNSNNDHFYLVL